MTEEQWDKLLAVIEGELFKPLPTGFIIDSPWLPGWAGISVMDYFCNEQMWFQANLKAVHRFPEIMFFPGFWAEFGMCTEPSAFGVKCCWREEQWPYAEKVIADIKDVSYLTKPDPSTDGLLPFVLHRLKCYQSRIEQAGHAIKFAVSRGPLNIAAFLVDTTEFLTAIRTQPEQTHKLLGLVTDFVIDWLKLQTNTFPSIDGILILDDVVGFCGEGDFREMALPYLKRIFQSFKVRVKFFHNDAHGLVCAPYLKQMGVNLFNFSFQHSLAQMKELTENEVTLLGNIPTHDVLSAGKAEDIHNAVKKTLDSVTDKRRIILSCGGGMPPDVSTENIESFLSAVKKYS